MGGRAGAGSVADDRVPRPSPTRRAVPRGGTSAPVHVAAHRPCPDLTILHMLVCALGDLTLDVIVRLAGPIATGADTSAETHLAAGGQAANVAAWAAELGARARFIGKRGADEAGALAARGLEARGVEVTGPAEGKGGVICSLVDPDGERSMLSDRGAATGFPTRRARCPLARRLRPPLRLRLRAPRRSNARDGSGRGRPRARAWRRSQRRPRILERTRGAWPGADSRAPREAATRGRVRQRGRGSRARRAAAGQRVDPQARAPAAARSTATSARRSPFQRPSTRPAPATRSRPGSSSAGLTSRSRPRPGACRD